MPCRGGVEYLTIAMLGDRRHRQSVENAESCFVLCLFAQMCEQQNKFATPKKLEDEAETEDIGPRPSRCSVCQVWFRWVLIPSPEHRVYAYFGIDVFYAYPSRTRQLPRKEELSVVGCAGGKIFIPRSGWRCPYTFAWSRISLSFSTNSAVYALLLYYRILLPHQHCPMQELLEDLQQKYPVVRDQSSWGDDTNPFCCDRCWESSPLPGAPQVAPPVGDAHGVGGVNSSPWESDDVGYRTRSPQHPAPEEVNRVETPALAAGVSRLRDDQGDQDGVAPTPSSNATEKGDRSPPSVVPTMLPESAEEDTRTIGSVRGDGVYLEVRGDGARADPPPTQKADAVAAAFSTHLHGVDKYPLELARLCRFAQFLTENELLREAYEVSFDRVREGSYPTD